MAPVQSQQPMNGEQGKESGKKKIGRFYAKMGVMKDFYMGE